MPVVDFILDRFIGVQVTTTANCSQKYIDPINLKYYLESIEATDKKYLRLIYVVPDTYETSWNKPVPIRPPRKDENLDLLQNAWDYCWPRIRISYVFIPSHLP